MGVRGLTTFIDKCSKRYFKSEFLRDTYLVIDGNCIASHLYKWCTRRDSAFGGDYDEYYVIVKRFFVLLKKCNITPIVVLDGGYETKKLPTVALRLKTKLRTLKVAFANSFSQLKFFPIFMKLVFCEAVQSCNVFLIQTDFEADREIAIIARNLSCPVLSYDSDFYIYDVLYIPFNTVSLDVCKKNIDGKEVFGVSCSLYDISFFVKEYPGLKKGHLTFLATVLGNDFIDSHIFNKFFGQIPLHKGNKTMSNCDRKIKGLLHWLSHETYSSAEEQLLNHLPKKFHSLILKNLAEAKENYSGESEPLISVVDDKLILNKNESKVPLSQDIRNLLRQCRLPSFLTDMVCLQTYFLPLQIEDLRDKSSHELSIPIINALYSLVCSDSGVTMELKLHIRERFSIKVYTLPVQPLDHTLTELRKETLSVRRKFIFQILDLNNEDINCIYSFIDDCHLFLSCFIKWSSTSLKTSVHMHALLFSFLVCQAQYRVGMCKLGNLEVEEMDSFAASFSSLRKTTDRARENYSSAQVHVFNIFQSILYHCAILNSLLGVPLKPCKVADSFSGTLVNNIFSDLNSRNNVLEYLYTLLEPTTAIAQIYTDLNEKFKRFFPPSPKINEVVRKRKTRRKKKKDSIVIGDFLQVDSDSCDYDDLNNKFSVLVNC